MFQAAASKSCTELGPWVKDIATFFWTCSREAKGDADVFRVSCYISFGSIIYVHTSMSYIMAK